DEGIERIEGEEILIVLPRRPDLRERAALRRLRIDVAEMREVGRVGEVAEGRHAVRFDLAGGASAAAPRERGRRCDAGGERKNAAAGQRAHARQLERAKRDPSPLVGGRKERCVAAAAITTGSRSSPLSRRPTTTP